MLNHQSASLHHFTGLMVKPTNPREDLFSLNPFPSSTFLLSPLFLSVFLSYYLYHIHTCSHTYIHTHMHTRTHTHPKFSQIPTPSGKALLRNQFCSFLIKKKISPVSLRSSLATGSVTPLMPAMMDALPSSPPREVWVMDLSSCWTFSRTNTCLSGERQVRGASFIHRPGYLSVLIHQRVKLKDKKPLLDSFVKHIFQAC